MKKKRLATAVLIIGLWLALLASGCGGGGSAPAPTNTAAVAQPPANTPAPTTAPTNTSAPTTAPTDTPGAGAQTQPAPTSAPPAAGGEIRQWAVAAQASSQYGDPDWAASQATGAPNTLACGDNSTAWASSAGDGVDWLELRYDVPIYPTQVNIVQSYNPNQVAQVELLDTAGTYHLIYTGQPAAIQACPYTLSIPVEGATYQAVAVRITVDQSARGEWNEIDAVELVGQPVPGQAALPPAPATPAAGGEQQMRQWAAAAQASSQYGDPDWAASQATGAPNTAECGDNSTAWASSSAAGVDWLELRYDVPVRPIQVNVVQSYNPNQVVRVELLDAAGTYHPVYTGQPALIGTCPYTLSIPVQGAAYQVVAVRITVDQSASEQWNEIDAVELLGWGTPR